MPNTTLRDCVGAFVYKKNSAILEKIPMGNELGRLLAKTQKEAKAT